MTSHFSTNPIAQWVCKNEAKAAIIVLIVFALLSRFLFLGHPPSAVFDEVHFNYFAGFYYTGQYYYDIHPPLGKLLIALAALPFGGIQPEDVVRTISTHYPNENYVAMRALPALFGALLPLLIFGIARELNIGIKAAFVAGAFIILDNALLIQSRLILLDSSLLFFGFLSLWIALKARKNDNYALWFLSALSAGCAISIKWLGVSFFGLVGLIILVDWLKKLGRMQWTIRPFFIGTGFVIVALSTYAAIFQIHFVLLPISHEQGDQFMTKEFRSTLKGSEFYESGGVVSNFTCPPNYKHSLRHGMPANQVKAMEKVACQVQLETWEEPSFLNKLIELNRTMYYTNQGLAQSHPDASKWYRWPMMHKPLYYWHHEGARIYLIGNPIVWWFCSLAVFVLLLGQLRFSEWRTSEGFWILLVGFGANLLPFMGVSRVMFMYHYLTCLCYTILIFAYVIERLPKSKWISLGAIIAAVFGFLLISPITYGYNWYGSDMLWFLRLFGWHP